MSTPVTPTPNAASATTPDETTARVAATADNWRRKLLDLTKRNRALNFKPSKVSTVTVVDERPAEVFRTLYIRERVMRFKAAAEGDANGTQSSALGARPSAVTSGAIAEVAGGTEAFNRSVAESREPSAESDSATSIDFDDDTPIDAPEFIPYDAASLEDRHTDEWLQTASDPEKLDRSLRRLDELARTSLEEQGVNTLFLALGMLHYVEGADSDVVLRAPLVLVPVELARKSARSGYTLRASEDEAIVNPALAEYLRRDHGIALPSLPASDAMPDEWDLQELMTAVQEAVKGKARWATKAEIHLATFSFQKFAMYKDLEANAETLRQHRLIRQLVTRVAAPGTPVSGLPDDVRTMELDAEYPPERTYQVVDADSSQLRAIAAASRRHDLVLEGPPGTGKSQTITNLIASALAAGQRVLFVAEKMAALSVVHDRLVRAKLGEFCLELHSTKANKRAVMRELAASLDASLQTVAAPTAGTSRLPHVRRTLGDYAEAVHSVFGALGASPYHGYGELGRVLDAPRVTWSGAVEVPRVQVDDAVRDLGDLAAVAPEVGDPATHPWRDSAKTFHTEDDLETVRRLCTTLGEQVADVQRRAAGVIEAFGLPPVRTFADVDTAAAVAGVLHRSPGAPRAVLESAAWNEPPAPAVALIARGRETAKLRERVLRSFTPEVLDQEHTADIAHVEAKAQGMFSFLAFLDGRWRAIKARWMRWRTPSFTGSLVEQANEMKFADRYRAERDAITAAEPRGRELFGALWQGERSDWDALDRYVQWVVEFRGTVVRHGLMARAIDAAASRAPDVSDVTALRDAARGARSTLESLRVAVQWPAGYLADEPLADVASRASQLAAGVGLGARWAAFESARQRAAASLAGELLPLAMGGRLRFTELAPAFLRAFWMKWLSAAVQSRPALAQFHTLTHEQRVKEFQELDQRVLRENQAALVAMLRDRVQHALRQQDANAQMPFLRKEMAKQRAHSPLRRTLQQAGAAIRAIKPCFMMSPLTVAQLLEGGAPSFDLVIFDEASQLPAEDAVGAIFRGAQLVVVGDPKQLPPTNFFTVSSGGAVAPIGDDGQPLYEDSESILEEYMGAGVPMSRLKWHYRSAHESLIAFSNVQFYEADLYTFPSVETGTGTHGLQFEHLPDGVYEGKGLNAIEAKRVADEVVLFAREQLERAARGEATQSLGVGTFNLRQQLAILDELEQRRRDDPGIEPFFGREAAEPFFVKNLENIQGDERDVIFISVTYARAADGKLRYNFGPLNGENGWRRLNVLVTRARQRMRVFSSMRGDEINAAATTSRGARLLKEFLTFAERGRLESVSASLAAEAESPFEQDVVRELTARGLKVVPQVGVAGYRIDMGILDDEVAGRFVCGIECDGVAYHSSETARDRDRLRQQVLEARGWQIHRVWSTDWFKDRPGQVERLVRLVSESKARAKAEVEQEREAVIAARHEAERRARDEAEAEHREAAAVIAGAGETKPYVRPVAVPYAVAPGEGQYEGQDLLAATQGTVARAVVAVVDAEAPVHEADVVSRVAAMWGKKAGARIADRIRQAIGVAEASRSVVRRGAFLWKAAGDWQVRSRASVKIPAERIAPEEYRYAILMVLEGGHAFPRAQLTNEVRAVLGFARTGAALDEAIGGAIDLLLQEGQLGEGSGGIRIRQGS